MATLRPALSPFLSRGQPLRRAGRSLVSPCKPSASSYPSVSLSVSGSGGTHAFGYASFDAYIKDILQCHATETKHRQL
jgi:hypothetical protein